VGAAPPLVIWRGAELVAEVVGVVVAEVVEETIMVVGAKVVVGGGGM
jgi:hypothetical protein